MAAAPAVVPHRNLGSQRLEVSAQGLGCMGMSTFYGPPRPEPTHGCAHPPCRHRRRHLPRHLRHVGEPKKLVEEGKIKYIGLSGGLTQFILSLQWSLWSRDVEEDIIPTCRQLGIVAYSPLGRGFSSGVKLVGSLSEQDFRKFISHDCYLLTAFCWYCDMPRFQPENREKNAQIFQRVNKMATRKGCTPSQLALAWVHHQGTDGCPKPGTTKIENFIQNVGALSVKLTPEEMAELESCASAGDVQGDRYPQMANTWQDSETPPLSSWN